MSVLRKTGDQLKTLNIERTNIRLDTHFSASFPELVSLNLEFCRNVTEAGFTSLLSRVGGRLKFLNLGYCKLSLGKTSIKEKKVPNSRFKCPLRKTTIFKVISGEKRKRSCFCAAIQKFQKVGFIGKGSRKKKSSTNGRAIKSGGGGIKAGPLRKKELFLKLFLFCCHFDKLIEI